VVQKKIDVLRAKKNIRRERKEGRTIGRDRSRDQIRIRAPENSDCRGEEKNRAMRGKHGKKSGCLRNTQKKTPTLNKAARKGDSPRPSMHG